MNKLWSLLSLIVLVAVFSVGTKMTGKIIPPPPWGDPPCKIKVADFNPSAVALIPAPGGSVKGGGRLALIPAGSTKGGSTTTGGSSIVKRAGVYNLLA